MAVETNRKEIVRRLEKDGWINEGGGKHDVFKHPAKGMIIVPRHRTLSDGVAASLAKVAGWSRKGKA